MESNYSNMKHMFEEPEDNAASFKDELKMNAD